MKLYLKVTKPDGKTLFNHDGKGFIWEDGKTYEEPELCADEKKECAILMQFVMKCILYPIFLLIMIIFLVIFHYTYVIGLHPQLDAAYDMFDTGNPIGDAVRAPSIWNQLEVVGWIILGIFVFVGTADLILSAQKDEYEPYEYPYNNGGLGL